MFDQFRNMASLLSQAGQIKERAQQVQDQLAKRQVTGDAGAGAVRVTMTGKFEVVRVELDRPLLQALTGDEGGDETQQMVEELIAGAFNAAHQKVQAIIQEEIQKAAGGLNLPGLDQLFKK